MLIAADVVEAPIAIELLAVAVGGLFGSLIGVRRGFDALGVAGLALLCGLGGGIARDVLLNLRPVALIDAAYVLTAAAAATVGIFFAAEIRRATRALDLLDAAVMGLYGVAGASKALRSGLAPAPSIVVGLITAVTGGVLCDIATARRVSIFVPGPLHATAPVVGTTLFVGLAQLDVAVGAAATLGVLATFAVRILGLGRGVHGPLPRNREPLLTEEHP